MKLLLATLVLSCLHASLAYVVEFRLFTESGQVNYEVLDEATLAGSSFDSSRYTKFITHGWQNSGDEPWMHAMKDELLAYSVPFNVIIVDWEEGANEARYDLSADNTDETGRQIYEFIMLLKSTYGYQESMIHLIGHSLGAHASGAAGKRIPTVGRITGLDPAGPSFDNYGDDRKLDSGDAQFVDIMHTDGNTVGGLGCWNPSGHVDFYPNGGKDQPGCGSKKRDVNASGGVGCDHGRAHEFFTESINTPCAFQSCRAAPGETCDVYSCGIACNYMGFHATKTPIGNFYLTTKGASPYCVV